MKTKLLALLVALAQLVLDILSGYRRAQKARARQAKRDAIEDDPIAAAQQHFDGRLPDDYHDARKATDPAADDQR